MIKFLLVGAIIYLLFYKGRAKQIGPTVRDTIREFKEGLKDDERDVTHSLEESKNGKRID